MARHIAFLASFLMACPALAVTFDDTVSDFSGDPLAPTELVIADGDMIVGSMGGVDTRDYFTFTIGADEALTSITLDSFTDLDIGGPGNRSFHALDDGATSAIPSGATIAGFLGGNHLDASSVGTDLLAELAAAPLGGTGFSTPLGAGTYTYLVQQTGPQNTGYLLTFGMSSGLQPPAVVPVPPAIALLGTALVGLGLFRRRA